MSKPSSEPSRPAARVVKGMESTELGEAEFKRRFLERFADPRFGAVAGELDKVAGVAWQSYAEGQKSTHTQKAGPGFADPERELALEWLAAREAILEAERARAQPGAPARFLVINGSSRSDQTCPGEMSKTYRLAKVAEQAIVAEARCEVDFLDLSRMTSEYGRHIHPCKACVSTAQPLCHWPCTCYPHHALGQVQDWMNELYPRWAAAHGVLIVTPVHWYMASSPLKLMMDRLVCADGGNPDPTSTGGKDALRAKELELAGWSYPKHLAGRAFAVVVHGDAAGAENLRRILCDWLVDMDLVQAGPLAALDRYIGYYRPYATSHDDLDADLALPIEVENAAKSLVETVRQIRAGTFAPAERGLDEPRKK